MTIYAAETGGRAIAVFYAKTEIDAYKIVADDWFLADPVEKKLCDSDSEIHVREALDDERAKWEAEKARTILEAGVDGSGENPWLIFI